MTAATAGSTICKVKKLLGGVGAILKIPGYCALASIVVSWYFGEYEGVKAFGITAISCLMIAYSLSLSFRNRDYNFIEIMILAFTGWLLTILAGTLPFLLLNETTAPVNSALTSKFINSFFEATSGFTSTGLTMVEDESMLSYSLQWWRSLMQWIGGIGIIIFLSVFTSADVKPDKHYSNRTTTIEKPSFGPKFQNTWWIYVLFTVLSAMLLLIQDIPLWESINHAMTAIATGGFTITNNSLSHYSASQLGSISAIMVISALSFSIYFQVWKRRSIKPLLMFRQTWFFLLIAIGGVILISLLNSHADVSFVHNFFQLVSALSTGGFTSVNPGEWNAAALIILSAAMMTGGTTNSTTGGIKIARILIMLKGVFTGFIKQGVHSGEGVDLRLNKDPFKDEEFNRIFRNTVAFILVWLNCYWVLTVIFYMLLPGEPLLKDVIFDTSSALGNVGQSSGITGPSIPASAKATLIITMILGRLEFIPLILLLTSIFRRTHILNQQAS